MNHMQSQTRLAAENLSRLSVCICGLWAAVAAIPESLAEIASRMLALRLATAVDGGFAVRAAALPLVVVVGFPGEGGLREQQVESPAE